MQRDIGNEVHFDATASPFENAGGSSAIDRTASNYNDAKEKIKKIREHIKTGKYDADVAKYIPGALEMVYQGMLEDIDIKEKVAHSSYKDIEQLDFQMMLTDNYHVNPNSIRLFFPMKIKKSGNESSYIDSALITVNNFLGHLVKVISITKCKHDKQLIPTFSPYEIYQYSDSMLKYLPKDSFKKIEKTLLYSKEPVYFNKTKIDRRIYNGSGTATTGSAAQIAIRKANDAKDLNIGDRISKIQDQLKNEYVYRIPPDVKIMFTKAPFIQYQQLLLDKNFRQYLETIMVSKKILRMGAQKTPIQKTYEIGIG